MTPRRLLVLAPNWLGDAVMALPLFRDLRAAWPDTHIAVAARPGVAPLFGMVASVDETVALDGKSDRGQLRARGFDAALLLPNSFASAWLVTRAGIPERWGYARDLRRPLLTKPITRLRSYGHQVEYYQALGPALGLAAGPPFAAITVPPASRVAAAALLREHGIDDHDAFVVMAPGAAYGRAKQWLPSRFAELARLLTKDSVRTVLVGAKGDVDACNEVARNAEAVLNLAGQTDLVTLVGLLTLGQAVVANDSGAMHLAAAAGVPVTAIFGPTNDAKTAPLRATDASPAPVIVSTDVWCRPCMLRECPIDHRCMTHISAARVYAAMAQPSAPDAAAR